MAVRVLLVAAFTVLYGCGQASSPVEKQEKQGDVEQAAEGEEQPETVTPHPASELTTARAGGQHLRLPHIPLPCPLLAHEADRPDWS
jgi:hypothetical protein